MILCLSRSSRSKDPDKGSDETPMMAAVPVEMEKSGATFRPDWRALMRMGTVRFLPLWGRMLWFARAFWWWYVSRIDSECGVIIVRSVITYQSRAWGSNIARTWGTPIREVNCIRELRGDEEDGGVKAQLGH